MEDFLQALQAYQRLDPAGWVSLYRLVPLEAALVMCAVGVALVLFGGGRLFRAVAGPLGMLLGLTLTDTLLLKLGLPAPSARLPQLVAAVLAAVGFIFPPAVLFLCLALPVGLLAGELAGREQYLLGFCPGFVVGGLIALGLHRLVSALLASALGAWLLTLGTLAALRSSFLNPVQAVASYPLALLAAAGLVAIGGTVFQVLLRPPPEEEPSQGPARRAGAGALEKP